jgi:hypothetical protein
MGQMGIRTSWLALAALTGCSAAGSNGADGAVADLSIAAAACMPAPGYPSGPYGYRAGRVIADLQFQGRSDSNGDGIVDGTDALRTIAMHDYYQSPDVRLLAIIGGALWCVPCNDEQPTLNALFEQYQPKKVALLTVLLQAGPGAPATLKTIDGWGQHYQVPYSLAIDPKEELGPYFLDAGFPGFTLVRTSDMQILWQFAGARPDLLQQQIDAALAGPDLDGGWVGAGCDLSGDASVSDDGGGGRAFCDPCAVDGDCAAGLLCATDALGAGYCTKRCGAADDCPQNYSGYAPFLDCVADTGGRGTVCRPIKGACHGAGGICDPCRPDVAGDCAKGAICVSGFSGEHFCSSTCNVNVTWDMTANAWSYTQDTCPAGSYCQGAISYSGIIPCGMTGMPCALQGICTLDPTHAATDSTCEPAIADGGSPPDGG